MTLLFLCLHGTAVPLSSRRVFDSSKRGVDGGWQEAEERAKKAAAAESKKARKVRLKAKKGVDEVVALGKEGGCPGGEGGRGRGGCPGESGLGRGGCPGQSALKRDISSAYSRSVGHQTRGQLGPPWGESIPPRVLLGHWVFKLEGGVWLSVWLSVWL